MSYGESVKGGYQMDQKKRNTEDDFWMAAVMLFWIICLLIISRM